jgi:hypothetical protein
MLLWHFMAWPAMLLVFFIACSQTPNNNVSTMPACCPACKTPSNVILPLEHGGYPCAVCSNSIHPACLIGPAYEIPEYLNLMRATKKAVLPDDSVCCACILQYGGGNDPNQGAGEEEQEGIQANADSDSDPDDSDIPLSALVTHTPAPRQARSKRLPERFRDNLAKANPPPSPMDETPMKRLYNMYPLSDSPNSPTVIHHFLPTGQSIKHKHLVPVPVFDINRSYKLMPKSITVMKDSALAAENTSLGYPAMVI